MVYTVIVGNEPYTVLARIDFVSLYFRLLWYHSILRGSIDQKHAKTNELWRQNSEIHSAFACSRWPPWFPDLSRPYGACMKRGSGKHIFGLSLFCLSRQSNISTSGEERFKYALPPGPTKTIKSPPHALTPPPARRHDIDRCIMFFVSVHPILSFHCHAIKIITTYKPLNTESPVSGKWKKMNIQKASPRIRSVWYLICKTFGKMFYPNLKSFVWRCHIGVPLRGANMVAKNQQKHLSLSFPTKVWIHCLRNSQKLK